MINKVTLIGFLGKAPEIRTLENGTQVASFSVATSESFKDKNGERQKTTEWHNIVAWRELAERCSKFAKGELVYIEGKVTYRKYTGQDSIERTVCDIVASTVRGLTPKELQPQGSTVHPAYSGPIETSVATDDLTGLPF